MAFKVAGESIGRDRQAPSHAPRTDISLAAFGRKEIEIAEVEALFSALMFCVSQVDAS